MKLASIAFTLMQVLAAPLVGAAAIPDAELSVTERDTVSSTSPGLEKRAPCAIHLGYDSWWRAGAHDRYRVWFNAEGSGPRAGFTTPYDMLNRYCTIAKGLTSDWEYLGRITSVECWLADDRSGAIDISVFIGSNGKDAYFSYHQAVVNNWREGSGFICDVDSGRL